MVVVMNKKDTDTNTDTFTFLIFRNFAGGWDELLSSDDADDIFRDLNKIECT